MDVVVMPQLGETVVEGTITAGHADALAEAAASSPARRAALLSGLPDRDEAFLLAQAQRLPVDQFRKVTSRWGIAVDGETAEREHAATVGKESLVVARRRDGVALSGFLTQENGEILTTALRAVMGVLSLYMLIGMSFAFTYGAIDRFGDDPFFADAGLATVSNCLYFSFTTLTTAGYGDFVAGTSLGHTLAVFEALIGQIYLVTVVSLIVSNLGRPARRRET